MTDQQTTGAERRAAFFENARFFRYLPERTVDSLSAEQRRDIAHTIFELQRSNPRILQELYLDNPFVSDNQGSKLLLRIKRRFYLMLRTLWFSLLLQKEEKRRDNRLADIIFVIVISVLSMTLVLLLFVLLYITKSAIGIDLVDGAHLFCY